MGHTVADRSSNEADSLFTFCVIPVICMTDMGKCCDACGDWEYSFRSGFSASEGAGVSEASTAVDRKLVGYTLGGRSSNEADFL
jgi:hypothetical protein